MERHANDHHDSFRHQLWSYVIGLALAIGLTAVPFALVAWSLLPGYWILVVTFALGLLQIGVHFRFFLHVSLSRSSRDDLNLLLFTLLIILLLLGGTLVIMFDLRQRML